MRLVLDALREQHGSGPLGVRVHGVHDFRHRGTGSLLDQAQVQLDDVRAQQRHEGQRQVVGADIVEGDPPAGCAQPLHGREEFRRSGSDRPLGDLEDDVQLAGRGVGDRQQLVERGGVQHLRFHVDEQRQRGDDTGGDGLPQRRTTAQLVQLGEPAGGASGGEELVRALQRPLRPPGQRLVGNHGPGVQVHDGLEHAVHLLVLEHLLDTGHRLSSSSHQEASWEAACSSGTPSSSPTFSGKLGRAK